MKEIEVGVGTFFKPLVTPYYLGTSVEDAGEEMIMALAHCTSKLTAFPDFIISVL